jgi:hypothetical protein
MVEKGGLVEFHHGEGSGGYAPVASPGDGILGERSVSADKKEEDRRP